MQKEEGRKDNTDVDSHKHISLTNFATSEQNLSIFEKIKQTGLRKREGMRQDFQHILVATFSFPYPHLSDAAHY